MIQKIKKALRAFLEEVRISKRARVFAVACSVSLSFGYIAAIILYAELAAPVSKEMTFASSSKITTRVADIPSLLAMFAYAIILLFLIYSVIVIISKVRKKLTSKSSGESEE